jgi:hypothetical protein
MKAKPVEKENNTPQADHKKRQKQPEPLHLHEIQNANSQTQKPQNQIAAKTTPNTNRNRLFNHDGIPAVHGSQPAYADGAELMYKKLQASLEQTGDVNHPDTKKSEMDYKRTLSISELRDYHEIKTGTYIAKSATERQYMAEVANSKTEENKSEETINLENTSQLLSAKPTNASTADGQDPITHTITLVKNQKFNGKLIQTDEELNRFAEQQMKITRPLTWNPKYTDEQVKNIVANGKSVKYTISAKNNSIEKETKELSPDKKQFIKDATSTIDYIQNIRILDLLKQLSDEEIADYNNKISGQTTDPAAIEASLKAYIENRDKNRKNKDELETVKTKLYGLEDLYKEYTEYKSLLSYNKPVHSGQRFSTRKIENERIDGINVRNNAAAKKLTESLNKNGFKSISEFESFIKRYETAFENETVRIGVETLQHYKHTLYKEEKKLSDDAFLDRLSQGIIKSGAKQNFNDADDARDAASAMDFAEKPTSSERALKKEMKNEANQKERQGNNAIQSLSVHTPLVNDPNFDKEAFAKITNKADLKAFLQDYITTQNQKVDSVISNIQENPEHIYELDNLFQASYAKQKIEKDTIYDSIIKAKNKKLSNQKILIGICKAIFAIALIAITWGAATPVVIAGGALSLAVSIDAAYEAINEYKDKKEFHDVGLLSDDPSLVWVVLAIAGVALDAGALAAVLKSAKRIATATKAFNEAEDATKAITKLENDLSKIEGLNSKIQQNIVKQAKIQAQQQKILDGFVKARQLTYVTIPGLAQTGELLARAVFAIRKGIVTFDSFITELKLAKLISETGLNPEELLLVKNAFEDAKAISALDEVINFSAKSKPTFGHTFLEHGQKELKPLLDKARAKNTPQGLWTNDEQAAEIIRMNWLKLKEGENVIDIPQGLGKVIMPDGTILENVTKALIIKNGEGATNIIKTAYPVIIK